MAKLVLGPLLRYVSETEAVIWVETDEACEVEVLGHTEPTFCVGGHHFGIVIVEGLEPGSTNPYEVALAGVRRWPEPDSELPPSAIRTLGGDAPLRFAFGSCRVSLPHHGPYVLPKGDHPDGREFDALYSLVEEMLRADPGSWPRALLMLGDQVYADEVSPETVAFIRKRRDVREPPGEEVADFEEYTRLYRESWEDPNIRWLLSTVSVSMVIDDHDIHDDWNISAAWVEDMRKLDWWAERECSGIASYWLYQFIGNLSPRLIRESELLARVRAADDGWEVMREFAANERGERDGARWSYCRDLGRTRLIVIDSRIGRVLDESRRSMLNPGEWAWLEQHLRGDFDHLLIGTSDPLVLAPALHHAERWGEAVARGAWGERAAAKGEELRRAADFDHWGSCAATPTQERTSIPGRPSASPSSGSPGCLRRPAPVPSASRRRRSRSSPATSTTPIWRSSPSRARRGCAATSGRPSARRFATRSTTASARRSTSATPASPHRSSAGSPGSPAPTGSGSAGA